MRPILYFRCLILIFVVVIHKTEVIKGYGNRTLTLFGQFSELYPKISTYGEARFWRMARNDVSFKDHPCKRECVPNQHMTCYYYMLVHYDETMGPSCQEYLKPENLYEIDNRKYVNIYNIKNNLNTLYEDCKYADGARSDIKVVNGQLPGLSIEACAGDTIVADIINSMHEITTIHWHGMHQYNAPHMDGVPYITQYPIEPGQAFRYRFEADHVGTHWWHSHADHQRAYGLAGPLVIRQPRTENVHASLYDFDYSEHTIMIQDWMNVSDEAVPQSILINGLGRNISASNKRPTLYAKFEVARNGRYRFRVIFNGNTNCPVSLSIDGHDLLVIASDGNDIEPILVQNITFHGGERHDFVLHAKRPKANYWIRVKGHSFCTIKELHQEAILHYMGADRLTMPKGATPSYAYEAPNAVTFNGIDISPSKSHRRFSLMDTKALLPKPQKNYKPFRIYYTSMNIIERGGSFLFQMDDITFAMPKISLLQTRNLGIGNYFCNRTQQLRHGFNCLKDHCRCTNVIQMPAFKNVEMVIAGRSETAHPIHLHGFTFQVVGMGVLGKDNIDKIEEIDRKNPLPRRTAKAPLKDTVQVPAYGYTIIRFYTNNPGYWIIHCHISVHSENGMAAILRVGEDVQMKMCPVSNCGLCNSSV